MVVDLWFPGFLSFLWFTVVSRFSEFSVVYCGFRVSWVFGLSNLC